MLCQKEQYPKLRDIVIKGHPLSTYTKFPEKLTLLTSWYAHERVRIRGLEMLVFLKILCTYLIDDSLRVNKRKKVLERAFFNFENYLGIVPLIVGKSGECVNCVKLTFPEFDFDNAIKNSE